MGMLGKMSKIGEARNVRSGSPSPESGCQCTAIFTMLYIRIIYELSAIYRKNTAVFKALIIVFSGLKTSNSY